MIEAITVNKSIYLTLTEMIMAKKPRNKKSNRKSGSSSLSANKQIHKAKLKKKSTLKRFFGIGIISAVILVLLLTVESSPLYKSIWLSHVPNAEGLPPNTPRLTIDKQMIDYGTVEYDVQKFFSFTLTNSGNDILKFTRYPYIEVVEGC